MGVNYPGRAGSTGSVCAAPAVTSAHKHTPHAWNTLVAKPPDVHSWAGALGALPPK